MIVVEPSVSSHSRPNDSILRCGWRVCGNDPSKDGYPMAQNKPKLVSRKNLRSFISTPSPHLIAFFIRTYLYWVITGHFAIVIAICYLPLLLFSLFHWRHLKQPHDTSAPMGIHAQIFRRENIHSRHFVRTQVRRVPAAVLFATVVSMSILVAIVMLSASVPRSARRPRILPFPHRMVIYAAQWGIFFLRISCRHRLPPAPGQLAIP